MTASTVIDRRVPTHLAILVGVSAGAYAVSLAGITALQSSRRRTADRGATAVTAGGGAAARDHDALEQAVAAAADRYAALADRYDQAGAGIGGVETALDGLATRAASLTESAAKLRVAPFSLPRVARSVTRSVSAPKTHATTRSLRGMTQPPLELATPADEGSGASRAGPWPRRSG